jgi:hypothetical protein
MPVRQTPPLTMDHLDGVIARKLLPAGQETKPLGAQEYEFRQPGMTHAIRIATNCASYEDNAESVELLVPGQSGLSRSGAR